MKKFTPFADRALLKPHPKSQVRESGIIIPDTATQQLLTAEIVDIGEGTYARETGKFMPTRLKKGQQVLLFAETGMPMEVDGQELLLIGEGEILGIV